MRERAEQDDVCAMSTLVVSYLHIHLIFHVNANCHTHQQRTQKAVAAAAG